MRGLGTPRGSAIPHCIPELERLEEPVPLDPVVDSIKLTLDSMRARRILRPETAANIMVLLTNEMHRDSGA